MVLAAEPPETIFGLSARGVERLGAFLVDQRHRALRHVLGDEIGVVGQGDDVDQTVAETKHVDRLKHERRSLLRMADAGCLAPPGGRRQCAPPFGRPRAAQAYIE